MWAQVDVSEFYKQLEKKKQKTTHCITVDLFIFLRASYYDVFIITVLKFIAKQLS